MSALGTRYWEAQLPHHGDEVAARMDAPWSRRVVPLLAESDGPAGFAVHWHIARNMDDLAVDALLTLAARGQLDARLRGGLLQALVRKNTTGSAKGATEALRSAAETGAYATVWSVLAAALPGMLHATPVRGAGASSQTVKNARLLRDTLR